MSLACSRKIGLAKIATSPHTVRVLRIALPMLLGGGKGGQNKEAPVNGAPLLNDC